MSKPAKKRYEQTTEAIVAPPPGTPGTPVTLTAKLENGMVPEIYRGHVKYRVNTPWPVESFWPLLEGAGQVISQRRFGPGDGHAERIELRLTPDAAVKRLALVCVPGSR